MRYRDKKVVGAIFVDFSRHTGYSGKNKAIGKTG
jgi:hypothetical protein